MVPMEVVVALVVLGLDVQVVLAVHQVEWVDMVNLGQAGLVPSADQVQVVLVLVVLGLAAPVALGTLVQGDIVVPVILVQGVLVVLAIMVLGGLGVLGFLVLPVLALVIPGRVVLVALATMVAMMNASLGEDRFNSIQGNSEYALQLKRYDNL